MQIHLVARPGGPGRCPFCHDDAPPQGQGKSCGSCGVRLHDACHALLLRCPTPGCSAASRSFQGVRTYLVADRYQVLGRVGTERYGTAISAYDQKELRDVTLLYLEQTIVAPLGEEALAEALAAAQTPPRGVPLLGYGRDPRGDRLFLVREFVPGGESLARVLERRGALPPEEVVWLGRTLLDSLGQLHQQGRCYDEVSGGESLLLERREGQVHLRLANAGLRPLAHRLQAAAGPRAGGGSSWSGVQDLAYVPPEDLLETGTPDPGLDLFATGVLLYRCLSGALPWSFRDVRGLLELRRRETPATPLSQHLPRLDATLEAAIMQAISLDPAQRHRDAQAFLAALPSR